MAVHIAELESAIAKQNEEFPFSGVIWIEEQGKTIFAKSYGLANRSEAIPNNLNTRFATASGTKTFTSAAICQEARKTRVNHCIKELSSSIILHHDRQNCLATLIYHAMYHTDFFRLRAPKW